MKMIARSVLGITWAVFSCWMVLIADSTPAHAITIGKSGSRFTIDGQPTFLLGVSYYDVMNWHDSDLAEFQSRGYNLIRTFLELGTQTALDPVTGQFSGQQKVLDLIRAANDRGIVVDITVLNWGGGKIGNALGPGNSIAGIAVANVINALKNEPNVLFDIRNEHNLKEENVAGVPVEVSDAGPLYQLTNLALSLHPQGLIFASDAGLVFDPPDYNQANATRVGEELNLGHFSLLAPHLNRSSDWAAKTGQRIASLRTAAGPQVPIYLQEENRQRWPDSSVNYPASDFLAAATQAKNAGAAAWIFHTNAGFQMANTTFMDNLQNLNAGCVNTCEVDILNQLPAAVFGASSGIRIEAESMALASGTFGNQSNGIASGGLVKAFLNDAVSETGVLTSSFVGASGVYDIQLGYFDESDGAGSFTLKINNVTRATIQLNQNTSGSGSADLQAYRQAVIATGVQMNSGDQIRIEGVEDQGEHNRLDYIQFNPSAPSGTPIVMQAESMTVASGTFAVQSNGVAQGQLVMAFPNDAVTETGALVSTFSGSSGTYTIQLGYFDESDGAGTFTIKINNITVAGVILNQNVSGTGLADLQAYRQAVIATGVQMNSGDQIRIEGVEDQGEHNRLDYIQFTGGASPTIRIEAESMTLNGFQMEGNATASGGQVMAFTNETVAESGFATGIFSGSPGVYKIRLGYFDESDGAGSLTLKINNVTRATIQLNQNLSGTGLADQQAYRQAVIATGIQMNPGDQIRIEGIENQGEHNRVDYIEFEP
ncbi:MAG: hypothetical protein ABL960_12340 [Nitrospira sp.]